MALKRKPFFYDAQLKRYLVQVMAAFRGYQVQTGLQRDGKSRFLDVPVKYGDMSRVGAYVMHGGSDNTMAYLPVMAIYMTGLRQSDELRLNPQHREKYNYIERAKTPDGELIVNQPGKKKTVERHMGVPYSVNFEVRIWARNNDQGYQMVEQLCTQFNPSLDLQLRNSPADWTFMRNMRFEGDVRMEKAVPTGLEANPLYVFTLPFVMEPVWMNPPAKVYETKHIYEIHVPIKELDERFDFDRFQTLDELIIRADENDILVFENLS